MRRAVGVRVSFSPDGRKLMWDMVAMTGNEVIVVAKPDGSAVQVIDHGTESDSQPAFARNGQRIVSDRADVGSGGEIVTSNLAGGGVRVLSSTIRGEQPVWAPNGKTVLFTHGTSIWTVGVNGQAPRRLIPGGQDPDFSPNGKRLAFGMLTNNAAQNLKLSTLPVAGGQPKPVDTVSTQCNGGFSTSLSWQPRP